MIKKIVTVLIIMSVLIWFTHGLFYDFQNFPVINKKVNTYKKWDYKILKYTWVATIAWYKLKLNDIEKIMKPDWYFKFLKYSYYWKDTFFLIKDNNIDLSYLDNSKLVIPIISYYIWNELRFIVFNWLLTPEDQDIIWDHYKADKFSIQTYKKRYVITYKTKVEVKNIYDYKKYYNTMVTLAQNDSVVNFQVWQNPLKNYLIEWYWDDLIQLEVIKDGKLTWMILSMPIKKANNIIPSWTDFWPNYQKDKEITEQLLRLYEPIKFYYQYNWYIPTDLWSLYPVFMDITALNIYDHKLYYEPINKFCWNVWFKPISDMYVNNHSREMNNKWYWYVNMCVK